VIDVLLTKEVEIKWERANKKYYIERGYNYTKLKDVFVVPIEIVSKGSGVIVDVLCDYCNETIVQKTYHAYNYQRKKSLIDKDCCNACWNLKLAESMNLKYGEQNASNINEFQEKRLNTFVENFGTDNPMKVPSVVEKGRQTNIKKYGVSHPIYLEGEYERRAIKGKKTMYKNGTGASSRQQRYLHKIIGGEHNYPIKTIMLDIAFPSEKIYIEFDGSGHNLQVLKKNITQKELEAKERKRFYALRQDGWKNIRIVSKKDLLPYNDEIILNLITLAKEYFNSGGTYFLIDIDENKIQMGKNSQEYDYGKTKRISEEDVSPTT
jgi:very-short-patch-repair endonuclease